MMMIASVCWRCGPRAIRLCSKSSNFTRRATLVSELKFLTRRRINSNYASPSEALVAQSHNPNLVDTAHAPEDFEDGSAVVYENFVTPEESEALVSDLKARLKRRRYECGHWDAVIVKYKETELYDEKSFLSPTSQQVFDKVREHLLLAHHYFVHSSNPSSSSKKVVQWLPCHAIDYHKDGELNPHVDSVRYSGDIVSGLSLLSSGIMRLRPAPEEDIMEENHANEGDDDGYSRRPAKQDDEHGYVDMLLPPLSLYVLTGVARYKYTHELLPSEAAFKNQVIGRDHRLSVIFRDAKNGDDDD